MNDIQLTIVTDWHLGRRSTIQSTILSTMIAAMLTAALLLEASAAHAQVLQAFDDAFGIPSDQSLVIDVPGILDNDLLDGESAGEFGATAVLVTDVNHGTLTLTPDGAFTYAPGPSFDGSDQFVYNTVFGSVTSQATVTLTACVGGPTLFRCWNENAFLALAAEHGLPSFEEGFEDDIAWAATRAPNTAPTASSRGFEWRAADFDPTHIAPPFPSSPPPNELRTAGYGWAPGHGSSPNAVGAGKGYSPYAYPGDILICDIDVPPIACYKHPGITIKRESGSNTLHGAGGWFHSISAKGSIAFVLDGDWQNPFGNIEFFNAHDRFFGVLDTGPVGFNKIEFREVSGIVGDSFGIEADYFTVLAVPSPSAVAVPSMGTLGIVVLGSLLLTAGLGAISTRSKSSAG